MKTGSHHTPGTAWPARPFKIKYFARWETGNLEKVGSIVSCSSPEAVVRSTALRILSNRAEEARISLDGDLFATMMRQQDGALRFTVF